MTNLRKALDPDQIYSGYWSFCREERNLAAIFYHMLLCGDNLERFCRAVDYRPRLSDPAVYFEYAHLRDLWFSLGGNDKTSPGLHSINERKRQAIIEVLRPDRTDYLMTCSPRDFNRHFGAGPVTSDWCIQSPGTWSIRKFHKNINDPGEFLRTCMFKWSFNAKPDIVIHADEDHALCIEAKLESGEGQYPTSSAEKAIFESLGLERVSQTSLQRYLMEELLGVESDFLFLVPEVTSHVTGHRTVTWAAAFAALDLGIQPSMVNAWIKRVLGLG